MKMAHRLSGKNMPYEGQGLTKKTSHGLEWTGKVTIHPELLTVPLKWKKPRMIFVCSMSDLFHEDVPFSFIDSVFSVMSDLYQHTFQVLTKRPDKAWRFLLWKAAKHGFPWGPSPNIWIGTSVEDQKTADERIAYITRLPFSVRFLSCEPLVGPVNFIEPCKRSLHKYMTGNQELFAGINWVIAGGESGSKDAAPMHPDWVRSLRDQCAEASVPFFFKQWGEYMPVNYSFKGFWPYSTKGNVSSLWKNDEGQVFELIDEDGDLYSAGPPEYSITLQQVVKVGKKHSGNTLDGRQHMEFPQKKEVVNG